MPEGWMPEKMRCMDSLQVAGAVVWREARPGQPQRSPEVELTAPNPPQGRLKPATSHPYLSAPEAKEAPNALHRQVVDRRPARRRIARCARRPCRLGPPRRLWVAWRLRRARL